VNEFLRGRGERAEGREAYSSCAESDRVGVCREDGGEDGEGDGEEEGGDDGENGRLTFDVDNESLRECDSGDPERLTDGGGSPVGRFSPETRFPYSSPTRLVCPFSVTGGAPRPKLPRGTGIPPFCSNWAILSRRAPCLEGEDAGLV
jgi:hypothetical protein